MWEDRITTTTNIYWSEGCILRQTAFLWACRSIGGQLLYIVYRERWLVSLSNGLAGLPALQQVLPCQDPAPGQAGAHPGDPGIYSILYRETETKVSNRNVQEVAVYTRTTVVIAGWHLQNAAFWFKTPSYYSGSQLQSYGPKKVSFCHYRRNSFYQIGQI